MTENNIIPTQKDQTYDIIIVGSGAGGSTLAYQLSLSGKRILMIERGDFLTPRKQRTLDSVGEYIYHVKKNREGMNYFVGGDTKFFGAALYRMRESDFKTVEHENGISPAWPITYCDLEPYYEQAELVYRVHGSAEGDPSEPPRARPFPYPPIEHAPLVSKLVRQIERSGTPVSPIPLALDFAPEGKCILCTTCDGHYCQLDAKMDAETAALRPALATGNVRLMTNTECVKVLTSADGAHVSGVLVRHQGREHVITASLVAVCAGVRGSAPLLRRSRNPAHPDGLGNHSGCLGRYLAGHSVGLIFPFMGRKKVPPVQTKTFAVNGFYNGTPEWPYPTGVIQMAGQMPYWEEASRLTRPFVRFIGLHTLTCFYMTEALPTHETRLLFDGDEIVSCIPPVHNLRTFSKLRAFAVEIFRRSGYRVLARRGYPRVWHEVGTARLGADPGTSVVNPNCQVHGIKGLFVVDASIFPSAGAVNPALTIIALALRLGDYISRRH